MNAVRFEQMERAPLLLKTGTLVAIAAALVLFASPPVALIAGILAAVVVGNPFADWNRTLTKWLLQLCVVLLGFSIDLPVILRLGLHGALFAFITIAGTLALGFWLGRKLKLEGKTASLIAAGTAICGGSAVAAVSSVIEASEAEIAVSIGTIFLLNAASLYLFPPIGHWLHLTQSQFGLWSGIAIHDISSVVGASLGYGPDALNTATAVKLSRTLWIVPVTLAIALSLAGKKRAAKTNTAPGAKAKITIPWFIAFFLAASLARKCLPFLAGWTPHLSELARHGMTLVLFLVGTQLSLTALKRAGWRTMAAGFILWIVLAATSLSAILFLTRA